LAIAGCGRLWQVVAGRVQNLVKWQVVAGVGTLHGGNISTDSRKMEALGHG
jgi:hypothetical protein